MAKKNHDKRERLLQALIDIGQELASTTELSALLGRILDISRDVFHFDNAIIRLLDDATRTLVTAASYGYDTQATAVPISVGQGVMGRVAASGRPVLINDLRATPEYVAGIADARSELAVPLMARDKVLGVFNVESTQPQAFAEEDLELLVILGRQAATAIENARLYQNLRHMSNQYRDLHQFNSRILKSVDLGIYTVDPDLRITSWNPGMEALSGVREAEALGRDLLRLFPQLEGEGMAERLRQVLRSGVSEKLRLAHRDLSGEVRFQKRRIAALKDQGTTTGAVVIVEDVTEFKRLLDQTIQSEKLAELGRLSAGIAHEINNPLSIIAYAVQLLLREEQIAPDQQELLERIDSETDRLKALTGGLLSFSRGGETHKRFTDLNETVRDVLRLVKYELTRNNIEVHEDFVELPLVQADSNKLKQVFINLLMNAVQAMKKDGAIHISSRVAEPGWVEMAFADTGPGMDAQLQKKVFEPFFTTRKEGEGTGLGLYICRNIIDDHAGRLLLESAPGQGACFRIRLPVE
ncbi:ATP-binding protein [Geoalkalibacter halelectricus]|uniref:ATP-binding protein n=1 Tax=Geoalkalibacter halelectricus TaxID=2847045 RepID=UPI00266FFE51|nr:ATP-binding protein [Geoalkalibacter halelectricus]MDO3376987.1 GAF domain-containing protein [Geoalkalibacter halelectricus]